MMKSISTPILLSLAALAAVACDPKDTAEPRPITAAEVRKAVESRARDQVQGIERALATVQQSPFGEALNLGEDPIDDEIGLELTEHWFADDEIESTSPGEIVFRASVARVCGTSPDPDCARVFSRLAVRIIARSLAGDGLSLSLEINGALVGTLTVEENRVHAEVNLAGAKLAAEAILLAMEEDVSQIPAIAEGLVSATLSRNAAGDHSFEVSIDQPVRIVAAGPSPAYELNAGAGSVSFGIDANGDTFDTQIDLAAISASMSGELLADISGDEILSTIGLFELDFPGANGHASVTESSASVADAGFRAPVRIIADGIVVFSFSLNAMHGSAFDLEVAEDQEALRFAFTPAFDAVATFALGTLLDRGFEAPEWMRADELRVLLDLNPELLVRSTDEDGVFVKMISGSLAISSAARGITIDAAASTCLHIDGVLSDDTHPIDLISHASCQ